LEPKRVISWLVVATGFLGVAFSYLGMWVLITTFAAGVGWPVNLALVASGPTSGIGAAIACRKPRQKLALTFGIAGLTLWVALWVVCVTVFGFRFQVPTILR
jgi:hypothetical protein